MRSLIAVALAVAAAAPSVGAAAPTPTRVQGTVWLDADADGIRDRSETGIRALAVRLERRTGRSWKRVATLKTSSTGTWRRAGLTPGVYRIRMSLPTTAARFSPRLRGRNRSVDSDLFSTGTSGTVRVLRSKTVRLDAGIVPKPVGGVPGTGPGGPNPLPSSASGVVWDDLNNDGQRTESEPKMVGVVVEAWNATRSAVVASATSDIAGRWNLALPATGEYLIRVVLPAGAIYAQNDVGDDSSDSDVNDDGANAGFTSPVVFASGDTAVGIGLRTNTAAITIGDKVWYDSNANGIQDGAESGMPGVVVIELWNDSFTQRLATTAATTQAYTLPARAGGAYRVRATFGATYTCTVADATTDTLDSDVIPDAVNPCRSATIRPLSSTVSLDIGGALSANVGNLVWRDLNLNGLQDAGEPGVAGVRVELWDNARAVLWDTAVSDVNGNYTVSTSGPGTYRLYVTPQSGYVLVAKDAGDNLRDSDAYPSGPDVGWTDAFVVAPNVLSVTTYDFGLR